MANGEVKLLKWNDGSDDFLSCELLTGEGNGKIIISSPLNEYLDREQSLIVGELTANNSNSLTIPVVVSQEGMREEFFALDGSFQLSDDTLFITLKSQ